MAITKLENLINPQVLGSIVQTQLPKKIKVSGYAKLDTTLQGIPGDTITIPTFEYIGDAQDLEEGGTLDTAVLTSTTATVKVKQAGKAIEITDAALLSGYGDPLDVAGAQIAASLASKLDNDAIEALKTATLKKTSENIINYNDIVDAVALLNEEDATEKVLFINTEQLAQLRKDPEFRDINKYPLPVSVTGALGTIAGCQVVVTNRLVKESLNITSYLIQADALTIYMKANPELETDRDILRKTTVISAAQHYAVALTDKTKAVAITFKA